MFCPLLPFGSFAFLAASIFYSAKTRRSSGDLQAFEILNEFHPARLAFSFRTFLSLPSQLQGLIAILQRHSLLVLKKLKNFQHLLTRLFSSVKPTKDVTRK